MSISEGIRMRQSEESQEKDSLPEAELTTPVAQTGEKRKRVKMVARRSITPRTRPQPRSQPSQTPSSPKSSKPSRKSAKIAFQSAPRIFKPSAPIIEEISSSSTEGSRVLTLRTPLSNRGHRCSPSPLKIKPLKNQPLNLL